MIIKELEEIGVPVRSYVRPPFHRNFFGIAKAPQEDSLLVWEPEELDYDLHVSKKHRQAVLNVREGAREVPNGFYAGRDIEFEEDYRSFFLESIRKEKGYHFNSWFLISVDDPKVPKRLIHVVRQLVFANEERLSVFVPDSRFYLRSFEICVNATHCDQKGKERFSNHLHIGRCQGVSQANPSQTSFLVGVDEVRPFISVLKRKVNSVAEAHRELRPKGLKAGSVRQGEWFFEPCNKKQCEEIEGYAQDDYPFGFDRLENGSSHEAVLFRMDKEKYAKGFVLDRRHGNHKPLFLDRWHRVVRNNETTFDTPRAMRRYD